jgi:hypothetical protein
MTNKIKYVIYLFLLLISISLASAANMTIQELIDSYDYGFNNGTINVTSQDDYMVDKDSDGTNDTLIINMTTDATTGTYKFIVKIADVNGILVNATSKTLTASDSSANVNFPSELLSQTEFNYSIRINDNDDNLVFRKFNVESQTYLNYETGTNVTLITDENLNNNFIRINLTIDSSQAITTNITVTLAYNSSTISKTEEKTLSSGIQKVSIDFDNETIKSTHYNANFTIDTIVVGNKIFDFDQNTSIYNYEDFAKISYIKAIADGRIDSDNNNLSEFLEINFTVEVKTANSYTISYDLYDQFDNFVINISKTESLGVGTQNVQTLVNGSEIYKTKINGPYVLSFAKLHIGNDTKDIIFDAHTTNQSFYTDYERPPLPDLKVNISVVFNATTNITNITVGLSNIGQAPAFNVFLDLFDNVTYENNRSLAFMDVDESITYKFNITNSSNTTLYTTIADFDNLVDESNESNNIVQNTQVSEVVSLAIDSLTTLHTNATLKIFEFVILNDGDTTVTDVQWQFDTDDSNVINSTTNISSLAANEKAFVYVEHNFSGTGSFDVKANATGLRQSTIVTASLSSTVGIGDLVIDSFDDLNVNGLDVIFEAQVKNNLGTDNITNINWSLTTDDGEIINATELFNLASNESIFIYVQHQYSSGGTYNPSFTASNLTYSDTKSASVSTNSPPVITTIPDISFDEDTYNDSLNLSDYVSDAEDSDADLTWTVSNNVNVTVTINQTTKIANFTALANWSGSENIKFTVNDTSGLTDNDTILVTVNAVNDAPTFNASNPVPNLIWPEDTINNSINLTEHFYDIDSANLNFTASNTENVSIYIENITGYVNITPNANWSGIAYVVFTAIDEEGLTAISNNITLNVTPVNDAPTFTGTIPEWKWPEDIVNNSLDLTQYFSDIDGDSLKYNFTQVNDILISINNDTGIVNLNPNGNFTGVRNTTFTAIDIENLTASSNNVTLNVTPVNDIPVINTFTPTDLLPTIILGNSLTFNHTSSDVDNDPLTYSWELNQAEQSTEQGWKYTPAENEIGTHNVILNVSDGTVTIGMQWNVSVINQSDINVYDLSLLNQNSTLIIFGFSINNTGNNLMSGINWSLDTGQETISANTLFSLQPNESIFVFASYNYTATGDYTVTASATNKTHIDSESITIDIPDIEVSNLTVLNESETKRIFEFVIENMLSTNLTNVSWVFDTKNSNVINSISTVILQPNEKMFVYLGYNFTTNGIFNVNATAKNGTLIDSKNLTITI